MNRSNHTISKKAQDALLAIGHLYEVGGVIRDELLELPDAGIDRDYLICGVAIEDVISTLKKHGKVDVVGKSFGVIKYTEYPGGDSSQRTFDIALPRSEVSTGGGHKDFAVTFDPHLPIESDLKRRDFTINAMARSLADRRIVDPYGGQKDLENRLLRIVFERSFKEDPLRILRAVQFAARFDLIIEPVTWKAMRDDAHLVRSVSAERIAEELNKLLLRAKYPSAGFRLFNDCGALEHVLPELLPAIECDQPGGFHRWNVYEHTLHVIDSVPAEKGLRLKLASLFHDITKPQSKEITDGGATFYGHERTGAIVARKVMKRLRYSNELISDVSTLVERHMFTTGVTDKGLRRLIRRVGPELIFDLLELRRADVLGQGMGGHTEDVDQFEADIRAELERKPPFGPSDLALNGHDLMRLFKLKPGPPLGRLIEHLVECVLDNPADNTEERLTELAKSYLNDDSTHPDSSVNRQSDAE